MMWHRDLRDPIYRADVCLAIGSLDALATFLARRGYRHAEVGEWADGKTFQQDNEKYTEWFVWFPQKPSIPTIAHEALHVASQVLRSRGLHLCSESEEAFAYYFGALFEQITDAVSRYPKAVATRVHSRRGKRTR